MSAITTLEHAALARRVLAWQRDPVLFACEVLRFEPWDDGLPGSQADFMRAVARHDQIAVRSSHKIGKTSGVAALALWHFALFPGSRTVITAPVFRQVREACWREIKRLHAGAAIDLGGVVHDDPMTGLSDPVTGSQVLGFTADDPDAFSGISGPSIIYILDEASGVSAGVYEAVLGNAAGGATVILIGNPTQPAGPFFDAFSRGRWARFHVDSHRVARWQREHGTEIPGLATQSWIDARREDWGTDDPRWSVRVDGEFPTQSEAQIVGLGDLQAAEARFVPERFATDSWRRLRTRVGLDVARYGDDASAIVPMKGYVAGKVKAVRGMDSHRLAAEAVRVALDFYPHPLAPKPVINVDVIGVGAGVYDVLSHDYRNVVDVVDVNVASSADDDDSYTNLRTQLMFGVRDWMRSGGALAYDQELREELLATRYTYDTRGRFKAEPKDDVKERVGRSPDRGDGLMLAVYDSTMTRSGIAVKIPGL